MRVQSTTGSMLLVLTATTLWGSGGLFIRTLLDHGLEPLQVVYYSSGLSFVLLFSGLLLFARRYLYVPRRALPEVLAVAFLSGGLSFVLFALAVQLTGVSLATLLNFTAPAWVTLLAWRVLGESIDRRRLLALASALGGCVLLVRLYEPSGMTVSLLGALVGLASGLVWGSYQVFGKRVLASHHPFTLCVYSGGTAMLVLLPFQPAPLPIEVTAETWPWLIAFVVGPSLIGPVIFNLGLRALQAGVVSLLAVTQLVIGVLLGVLVVGETLELPQIVGVALVGASVLSLRPSTPVDPISPEPIPVEASVAAS